MIYVFKDEDLSYTFDFKVNGNLVVPDDFKYNCKVRKIDGTILIDEDIEKDPEELTDSYLDSDTIGIPADRSGVGRDISSCYITRSLASLCRTEGSRSPEAYTVFITAVRTYVYGI